MSDYPRGAIVRQRGVCMYCGVEIFRLRGRYWWQHALAGPFIFGCPENTESSLALHEPEAESDASRTRDGIR